MITEKPSGGQSFLASIQNLLIFAIFKSSLNLNPIRHWSENWCPGYLEHALCSSEIHLAAAKSLEIIGHVTNCCKRPIRRGRRSSVHNADAAILHDSSVQQLRNLCRQRNIASSGNKTTLLSRLSGSAPRVVSLNESVRANNLPVRENTRAGHQDNVVNANANDSSFTEGQLNVIRRLVQESASAASREIANEAALAAVQVLQPNSSPSAPTSSHTAPSFDLVTPQLTSSLSDVQHAAPFQDIPAQYVKDIQSDGEVSRTGPTRRLTSLSNTTGTLGDLDADINHYLSLSIAASTKQTYSSAEKRFLDFCSLYRPTSGRCLPADEDTLIKYAVLLARPIKYSSIKGYLAAVRHFHIRQGFVLDLNKCLRLQIVCRAIKRSQGTKLTRVRLPITIKHLRLFHSLLAISYTPNNDSVMLWAAMTLAFFGFLRLGVFFFPFPFY